MNYVFLSNLGSIGGIVEFFRFFDVINMIVEGVWLMRNVVFVVLWVILFVIVISDGISLF